MGKAAIVDLGKLSEMGSLVELLYESFSVKPRTYEYDYALEELPVMLDELKTGSGEGRSPQKHNVEN